MVSETYSETFQASKMLHLTCLTELEIHLWVTKLLTNVLQLILLGHHRDNLDFRTE